MIFLLVLITAIFVLVLFVFVVLGLVSSALSQECGWKEHLRNDLFCVEGDITGF